MNKTAYEYLKKQAIEAHLAGDAYKVIHICNVGIENLKSIKGDNFKNVISAIRSNDNVKFQLQDDLDFKAWHWCFSLYTYWHTGSFGNFSFVEKLEAISQQKNKKKLKAYKKFITWLVSLIESNVELKKDNVKFNINDFSDFFKSKEDEDIVLITYALELIFTKSEDKKLWVNYYNIFLKNAVKNIKLKTILTSLYNRLCWQSKIFFAVKIDEFDYRNKSEKNSIEEGVSFYYDCDSRNLLEYIENSKKYISLDSPNYIPFAQLLRSLFFIWSEENKKLSEFRENYNWNIEEAKYMLAGNSIKINVFIDNLENALNKNESSAKAWLLMIHSLRNWLIYSFVSSCRHLKLYFEKLPNCDDKILSYGLKGHEIDKNKDTKLRKVIYGFDLLDIEKQKRIFIEILTCPNVILYRAHELVTMLSDSIPYDLLPDFADWTLKLEEKKASTNGAKFTWLEFWNDIFIYADPQNEYFEVAINKLSDTIFKCLENPGFWHMYGTLFQNFARASKFKTSSMFIKKLKKIEINDNNFKHNRWTIIYNTCRDNHDLLKENVNWLSNNSSFSLVAEVYTFKLLSSKIKANVERSKLRNANNKLKKNIITSATKELKDILANNGYPQQTQLSKIDNIEFLEWDNNTIDFVRLLIEAYNKTNIYPLNKWNILQYLKNIIQNCSSKVEVEVYNNLDTLLCQDGIYVDFPMSTERYRLLSVQVAFCYAILRKNTILNVSPKKIEPVKVIASAIGHVKDMCFINALFSINIYFALLCKNPIEKSLFHSKAEIIVRSISEEMVKEMKKTAYKENPFFEKQMAGIINIISNFITSNEIPMFHKMLKGETHFYRNETINIFKAIILTFATFPSYRLRAAAGNVLSKWEASYEFDFDSDLADTLEKLRKDSRMRVQHACSVKET